MKLKQSNTTHDIYTQLHSLTQTQKIDNPLSLTHTHTHSLSLSLSLSQFSNTFMVPPLLSLQTPKPLLFPLLPKFPLRFKTPQPQPQPRFTTHFPISFSLSQTPPPNPSLPKSKTLFPGGTKRPELNVPTLILHLHPNDILNSPKALDLVDKAIAKWVRVVVLTGDENSGGKLYEAARLLKSVVGDRAYMLIAERVDVAAAVGASGVLLSDQGSLFFFSFQLHQIGFYLVYCAIELRQVDFEQRISFMKTKKLIK